MTNDLPDDRRTVTIDGVRIADDEDCYVIAELGHNHQGRVETAMQLIDEAHRAGASAVKLQKRDNRSLYTREMFHRPYDNENSFGATYGEHREALEFGRPEYEALIAYAREVGITLFATAFDIPSADFLAELGMPAFKIASGDIRNLPLLKHVGAVGRPVVFSTGAASMDDVRRAYDVLAEVNDQLVVLQCTASYPASVDELDLRVIETFRREFDAVIGYSGHDNGIAMPLIAYVLGARVIEKHFTLNRAMKGTDHAFSLEPQGLHKLVRDLQRARVGLGATEKTLYASEREPGMKMGKKLVAARRLTAGRVIAREDIAVKSPGDGIDPSHLDDLVGKRLVAEVAEDQPLVRELFDSSL
jgi:sialic acid synthase